jgi:hypothetical protein
VARKSSADTAKEKAAKQKKLVIGLSVFLVLAMGYAVKTMMSLNSGGSQPVAADTSTTPAPGATTTPATTTPVTTTPVATPTSGSLAAPTLGAQTTGATATDAGSGSTSGAPTTSGDLVAAVIPTAGVGQLQSFDQFTARDPFEKKAVSVTPSTSKPAKTPTVPSTPKTPTTTVPKTPTKPAAAPTTAVVSVNGTAELVAAGGSFPSTNPVFQLLSLTKTTAKVTIVGGSYASGASSITLTVNKPVTLVNTADGTRYTLLLFPQGTPAPAAGTGEAPTQSTPVTTTPTTTAPTTTTATGTH